MHKLQAYITLAKSADLEIKLLSSLYSVAEKPGKILTASYFVSDIRVVPISLVIIKFL